MCPSESTRRQFVSGALAIAATGLASCGRSQREGLVPLPEADDGPLPARADAIDVANQLAIHPRDDWGADLPPKGPMGPEDVQFLLVHHTATTNWIPNPRSMIRSVYAFHTGSAKRWNDVAYNFFVGPDGSVWEGRAGSLHGPVVADATGGNQGFSQLICLLGDFSSVAPTAAAQRSLVRLAAYLSARYGLSTWKNATATFVSRGSNKWPAGSTVTTSTLSGHRDVTFTACPGDVGYSLLPAWRRDVHPIVAAGWERDGLQTAQRLGLEAP